MLFDFEEWYMLWNIQKSDGQQIQSMSKTKQQQNKQEKNRTKTNKKQNKDKTKTKTKQNKMKTHVWTQIIEFKNKTRHTSIYIQVLTKNWYENVAV